MYKPYKKGDAESYALGLFPVIELLQHRPDLAVTVLVSSKIKPSTGLAKIQSLCAQQNVPLKEVDHSLITRLSRNENTFAAGVFHIPHGTLTANASHVVLVHPDDMGNVGTIMRTMLGFGVHDLALITPAADAYDPKTVRASMGAVFGLRVAHFNSFADYQAAFSGQQLYPFVLDGSQQLAQTTFAQPASLIFGQEGSGLPEEFKQFGTTITIEQSAAIDSLNVATSVAVALYHQFTQ